MVCSLAARGGLAYSTLSSGSGGSSDPGALIEGSGRIDAELIKGLSFGIAASYSVIPSLYSGIGLSAAVSIDTARLASARKASPAGPISGGSLVANAPSLNRVLPIFYGYYGDHPVGTIRLENGGTQPIEGVKTTFFVKQYMDAPKDCPSPTTMAPKTQAEIPLYALFNESILGNTEGSKVAAEIEISYRAGGQDYVRRVDASLEVMYRNAMTWDDDRHAAAFVTAKDPEVMKLAKGISGIVKASGYAACNEPLVIGMATHAALRIAGLTYQIDPSSPYQSRSKDDLTIDFLQFPRETLSYKAGDCDDLSILYAALLEAVGVDAAFVTVPGHIFIALCTGLTMEEASARFANPADLIASGGQAWLPIEVTALTSGFEEAWQTAALEWRDASRKDQAAIYPVSEAWKAYKPVGLPGQSQATAAFDAEATAKKFASEYSAFAEKAIRAQKSLIESSAGGQGVSAANLNKIGVLYARFGLKDEARDYFEKASAKQDFSPALTNLGNIQLVGRKFEEALGYFDRAARSDPKNALAFAGSARANYSLENFGAAKKAYLALQALNPGLAQKYAYIIAADPTQARAADASEQPVEWNE
jgi:tetratricopeptide (TPR) repeat protein